MNRRDVIRSGVAFACAAALPAWARDEGAGAPWTVAQFIAARRHAKLPQGDIAYVERGKGPAALFLHGYPLNGFQWRAPMAKLASYRRCIAPDLMGLGYTDVPADADLSPNAQATMVLDLMDRLGVREADFVTNDSGDGIVQLIVARHPDRVRSILLTNGDAHTNSPPAALQPFVDKAKRGEGDAWFERHLTDRSFVKEGIGDAFTDPDKAIPPEILELYFRPLVSSPKRRQQGQTYCVAMLPNPLPAIEKQLRAFKKPVRIVWARDNKLFPDEWAHWFDRTFPGSKGIRFVDNAQLFFPEERPELIVEEVRKLWGV